MDARIWTEERDQQLEDLYVTECMSVGDIAYRMGMSASRIKSRLGYLSIARDPVLYSAKAEAHKQAARDRFLAYRKPPEQVENKDEDHWRLCLSLGGFEARQIVNGQLVRILPDRRAA